MTGAYAQNWPGRGGWASRGAGFAAEWSEREQRDEGERGGRGERRGRKGHRHHHHHRDAANWLFSRGGGGGRHGMRPSPEELEQLIAWRRMGGGPFGGPSGPFGRGGGRGPGGRGRARRGDVRLALLRLLAEQPANGYQLMQTIEERSGGRWRPSPGSVYPTLQLLEDEGLVRGEEADGKRRFALTETGTAEQKEKAGAEAPWDAVRGDVAPEAFALQTSLRKFVHAVRQVFDADAEQQKQVAELLDEARRKVYAVLAEDK
jgi:DNA-binding PadR family transcriptional regulator